MRRLPGFFLLSVFSLGLVACGGSATVSVTATPIPDASVPGPLESSLEKDFRPKIQRCYETALQTQEDLAGTVTVRVLGSHGILRHEVMGMGPQVLVDCALEPLEGSRLQRKLGDGPTEVGFVLTVRFST